MTELIADSRLQIAELPAIRNRKSASCNPNMPIQSYPVRCYRRDCGKLAVYKIAARWSDGITQELKTYALSCGDCLVEQYRRSCEKQKACRLTRGETLGTPEVYELARGQRDLRLLRRADLELEMTSGDAAN